MLFSTRMEMYFAFVFAVINILTVTYYLAIEIWYRLFITKELSPNTKL